MKRLIRFYRLINFLHSAQGAFLYAIVCGAYSLAEHRANNLGQLDIAGMALVGIILFAWPIVEIWKESKNPK